MTFEFYLSFHIFIFSKKINYLFKGIRQTLAANSEQCAVRTGALKRYLFAKIKTLRNGTRLLLQTAKLRFGSSFALPLR